MSPCDACAAAKGCMPMPSRTYQTDGLFIAQMVLPTTGMKIAQHSHVYEHLTFLASGAVRMHLPGKPDQDFVAPFGITIAAEVKHQFTALADGTVLLCIHNTKRTGQVQQFALATAEDLV